MQCQGPQDVADGFCFPPPKKISGSGYNPRFQQTPLFSLTVDSIKNELDETKKLRHLGDANETSAAKTDEEKPQEGLSMTSASSSKLSRMHL